MMSFTMGLLGGSGFEFRVEVGFAVDVGFVWSAIVFEVVVLSTLNIVKKI